MQSGGTGDPRVVQQHSHYNTHDDPHNSWDGNGADWQTGADTSNENHSLQTLTKSSCESEDENSPLACLCVHLKTACM